MANIVSAPFYVPRPPQDNLWNFRTRRDQPLNVVVAAANPFTVRQKWPFASYDSAVWSGSPIDSPVATLSLVPYQYGNQYFSYVDGPAVWSSPAQRNSPALAVPAAVYLCRASFYVAKSPDVDPAWSGSPIGSAPVALNLVPYQFADQYFNYIDDASAWSFSAQQNMQLLTPQPFASRQWPGFFVSLG